MARTFVVVGVEAREVRVEVDVRNGFPSFTIVGLPDTAVRESRERVRAALLNAGFDFPQKRIIANLAPANLPKGGPGLDLAIAAALLVATGQIDSVALAGSWMAGELALDGRLRKVAGVLPMAERILARGGGRLIVAEANADEAAIANHARREEAGPAIRGGSAEPPQTPESTRRGAPVGVVAIDHLGELRLMGTIDEPGPVEIPVLPECEYAEGPGTPDLAELRGQPFLRWALEVAAAGGHSMITIGPPGAGKSMAARAIPSILPPLDVDEAIEAMRVASVCGRMPSLDRVRRRPYRAPHHTISTAGLVGGGSPPRPGEITLAHRGVLFLDELPEFNRDCLEALRQPLEEGKVTIVRAATAIDLPCRFMLVGAANPCPCGRGDGDPDCECSPNRVRQYRSRLSGALADRVDISVGVCQPTAEELGGPRGEASAAVRERVVDARGRQAKRLGPGRCNADMDAAEARRHTRLDDAGLAVMRVGHERLGLTGRGHDRVLRLARTLADLRRSDVVEAQDIEGAFSLRQREWS